MHSTVSLLARRSMVSPFADLRTMRNAVWMEPRLLAEVSYAELIDGRLRAPAWRGLVYEEHRSRR
jgi:hypothetical protein